MFFLFTTSTFLIVALIAGFASGYLSKSFGGWRACLSIASLLSFLPWWLHVRWTWKSLKNSEQSLQQMFEPSFLDIASTILDAFAISFLSTNLTLGVFILPLAFLIFLLALRYLPLLPLLAGLLYWHVPLDRLNGNIMVLEPDLLSVLLDSSTNIWFFWLSLVASAFLFGYTLTRYLEPHTSKRYSRLK